MFHIFITSHSVFTYSPIHCTYVCNLCPEVQASSLSHARRHEDSATHTYAVRMKDAVENFIPNDPLPTRNPNSMTGARSLHSASGASSMSSKSRLAADRLSNTELEDDPWLEQGVPLEAEDRTASASVARPTVHGPALIGDAYEQIYDNWEGIVSYNRPEEEQPDSSQEDGVGGSLLDELTGQRGDGRRAAAVVDDTDVEREGPRFDLGGISAQAVQDAIGMYFPRAYAVAVQSITDKPYRRGSALPKGAIG